MGALLLVGVQVARLVVLGNVPEGDARTIAVALWTSLTSGVRPLGLSLAAAGGVLAAVVLLASSSVRPRPALTWIGRVATPPQSRPARAVWCLAALVVGALLTQHTAGKDPERVTTPGKRSGLGQIPRPPLGTARVLGMVATPPL